MSILYSWLMNDRLVEHVYGFLVRHQLHRGADKKVLRIGIGVSAGLDSMALLRVAIGLKAVFQKQSLRLYLHVIHINHQSRSPQTHALDWELISKYTAQWNVPAQLRELPKTPAINNNESTWRQQRYRYFRQFIAEHHLDYFWTAHHLNDSWEWTQMQQAKSAELRTSLGIPLKRGPFIRPFMCLSRGQIQYWAKLKAVPFCQDQTNFDLTWERNWWRHNIAHPLQLKYQHLWRNYAVRSNQLAFALKLHLLSPLQEQWVIGQDQLSATKIRLTFKLQTQYGVIDMPRRQLFFHRELIATCIKQLSQKSRSSLQRELRKLCLAYEQGKKGPMDFASGIKISMAPGELIIYKNS